MKRKFGKFCAIIGWIAMFWFNHHKRGIGYNLYTWKWHHLMIELVFVRQVVIYRNLGELNRIIIIFIWLVSNYKFTRCMRYALRLYAIRQFVRPLAIYQCHAIPINNHIRKNVCEYSNWNMCRVYKSFNMKAKIGETRIHVCNGTYLRR